MESLNNIRGRHFITNANNDDILK